MNDDHQQTTLTSTNTAEIQQLLKRVTEEAIAAEESLQKVNKAAILAMTEFLVQSVTNSELVKLNRRKKKKTQRTKSNYNVARFMNQAVLDDRINNQRLKEWNEVIRELMRLGSDILAPKSRRRRTTIAPSSFMTSTAMVRVSPLKKRPQQRRTTASSTKRSQQTKKKSLIVILRVRVTLQELEQRNKEMEQQQESISDTDSRVEKQVQQQQQHVTSAADQLGRGMRTKRPARQFT